MKDNTVIVVDLSNYKKEYQEKVPFKGIITAKYDNELWVESLVTDKEYLIYYTQCLEGLPVEDIEKMIDLSKY